MNNFEPDNRITYADTLEDKQEPNSSLVVLEALDQAHRAYADYETMCKRVDERLDGIGSTAGDWQDTEYDIFWSSMEVLKPAIYARPPLPVVSTRFADRNRTATTAAEMLERCLSSVFTLGGIDETMLQTRDDLAVTNRGVIWLRYDSTDGQKVCIEHLDRTDFRHDSARKWADVNWVARRAWLTQKEMHDRFFTTSGNAYLQAAYNVRDDEKDGMADKSLKAGVWEVWHKAANRVYWVTDGVDVMLDEGEPHLDLEGFFPCPRPAYGTLKRRTLIPIPDYERYSKHFDQIDELTERIYSLLELIRMKGFVPAGGDVGAAVETALKATDSSIMIPVPGAALAQGGGNFIQWMPLAEIATAISGLIDARNQLFQDFYQLSGISDIMRGATDANETLGAQQIKAQYGSIRVRDKIDELQRIARDAAAIAGEIIAEKFSKQTLLDMSQMQIPTKAEVKKQLDVLTKEAEAALTDLAQKAKQAQEEMLASGQQQDPNAIEQQFNEQQQAIINEFSPRIKALQNAVVFDDVFALIRDDKARKFTIDIETDSTILTDEAEEKSSRVEFVGVITGAMQQLAPLVQAGEAGAKLAGALIKFAISPYRAGRELDGYVDEFIENSAELAGQQGEQEDDNAGLIEAQNKLAEAEMAKAQAQTMKVEADGQLKAAQLQQKQMEMQQKYEDSERKSALEIEKLRGDLAEQQARIEKLIAETQNIQAKTGVEAGRLELDAAVAADNAISREEDKAIAMQPEMVDIGIITQPNVS